MDFKEIIKVKTEEEFYNLKQDEVGNNLISLELNCIIEYKLIFFRE